MNNCNSRCCYRDSNLNSINNNFQNTNSSNMFSNYCQNRTNVFPENYLYGHAYTPVQTLNNTYTPEAGLQNGSIFPELISPYSPCQSINFIEYLKYGGSANE